MTMMSNKYVEKFLETALERHQIYVNKEKGMPKPWTEDVVLRDFFFCNVFRQLDKCSKWIMDNVIPYNDWRLIILYRFISTYEIFMEIEKMDIRLDDITGLYNLLERKHRKGDKIFNGCFIRTPKTSRGTVNTYLAPFILIEDIVKDGGLEKVLETNYLETVCKYLQTFIGVGGFMSYEYACDFAYSTLLNPIDTYTWANKGPGAQRGMSLILHKDPYHKMSQKDWLVQAKELLPLMQERFIKRFPDVNITMREVEHWLCEFQKYIKYLCFLQGEGKVKFRKYNGLKETV